MRGRLLVSLGLSLSAGTAMAQVAVQPQPVPAPAPTTVRADPLAPKGVVPAVDPQAVVPPVVPVAPVLPPPPPAVWQAAQVQDLLTYIRAVGRDGLDPRDYDPALLEAALRTGQPDALSVAANASWDKLVRDLALGHVRGAARIQWFVRDPDLPEGRSRQLLDGAMLGGGGIAGALDGLLPTHPQYGSLRNALLKADPADAATVGKIRLNMDRWRWLPRDLGSRYIIVNVPGEHATLVENGVTRWKHRAIAGAVKTPTPQLAVLATGVMLNPWWEVPPSLQSEVAGKAGYVRAPAGKGKFRWRQPPGPGNALGKIKFTMYNPQNIYLHDTNARGLFDARSRFLSHGCIRTENVLDLATELLSDDGGAWDKTRIDAILASKKTVAGTFVKPVPVYIVYFSIAALTDGNIVKYTDLYRRDAPVLAALNERDGGVKPAVKSAAK